MRSEPSKLGMKGARGRTPRGPRRGSARNSMLRAIALEALEPRTLLAALPTPTVLPSSQIDVSQLEGNESSPSVAVDQHNPNKLAAVWVINDPKLAPGPTVFVELATSDDAGATWSTQTFIRPTTNPAATAAPFNYATVTDPSVAFDRNDHIYVLSSHHQADNSSGALVLDTFDFSGPVLNPLLSAHPVYQWVGVDAATSPTLAVDDNVASFTDVNSIGQSVTQLDPTAGTVYVAWTSADTPFATPPS